MDKRINILFDHLNNDDLLKPDTVEQMVQIAQAVNAKDWDQAQKLFNEMYAAKLESEGTNWMVSDDLCNFMTMLIRTAGGHQETHSYWQEHEGLSRLYTYDVKAGDDIAYIAYKSSSSASH